jgi:membrane associated rhomboid family serine protease
MLVNVVLWFLLDGLLAWQTHLGGFLAGWIAAAGLHRWRAGRRE